MKHTYKGFLSNAVKAIFVLIVLFSAKNANACHGVAILGLTFNTTPTGVTVDGSSDAATCGCGPYYMQAEVTCNPSLFNGNPPVYTDPSWGTYPWFHSLLDVPGYSAPSWTDQCAVEPYLQLFIPFSGAGLCPGTTYYVRVREMPETGTPGPWSTPAYQFTTPGLPPVLTATAGANQYAACIGQSIQLNAAASGGCTGGYNYVWTPSSGLNNPNIPNPIATVNGPITYTCTITDQCVGTPITDTVGILLGAPPVSGTAAGNPTSVCSGGSSQIVLTGYTGTPQWQISTDGINWFNINGATNDTLNTGPIGSSLYFQAVVSGSGCGTANSNVVPVFVNPAPTADAGANTTICNGSSTTLNGSGGVSYSWMPGSLTGANPTVSPTVPTTYTVTVTDNNGCTATDQVTVSVSNQNASAGPDVTICSGSQATLLASGQGAVSYQWTPAAGLSNTTVANPVATPSVTTTYVVTLTNSFGCTDSDTITVNVTPAPPVIASSDDTLCAGGSTTLTASGATTYTWMPGGLTGSSVTVTPATTTTFVVTGDNGGCLDNDTVVVMVTPPPAAFAGPDFAICSGNQGTLNATGGSSYSWAPSTGIIGNPNQASVVINPTTNTTYTVTVVGAGGCISVDQITITVNAVPTVTASAAQTSVCAGSSSNLSASGAITYSWAPSTGLSSTSISNPIATPGSSITYTVTGVNSNGCIDTDTVHVTVIQPPQITGIYGTPTLCGDTSGTIVLGAIANGVGPYTYQLNGNPVTPVNNVISNLNVGSYTVTVTDAAGCTGTATAGVGLDFSQLGINASASQTFGVVPETVNFGSQSTGGINNYAWNFGDGSPIVTTQNPSHTYTQSGTYTVVVMGYNDLLQCAQYDTLYIQVFPEAIVTIPNIFTPNADGTNDIFIADLQGVKDVRYTIFDRWGVKINNFQGITNGWDGKNYAGNDMNDGVYYYILEVTSFDDNIKNITGFVQLIRNPKQ